jgi:hypothetical protein
VKSTYIDIEMHKKQLPIKAKRYGTNGRHMRRKTKIAMKIHCKFSY